MRPARPDLEIEGLLRSGRGVSGVWLPSLAFTLPLPHPRTPLEKVLDYLRSLFGGDYPGGGHIPCKENRPERRIGKEHGSCEGDCAGWPSRANATDRGYLTSTEGFPG